MFPTKTKLKTKIPLSLLFPTFWRLQFILMMYGWLQVLYIFSFAPDCLLGNIILAGFFFFFFDTLVFISFLYRCFYYYLTVECQQFERESLAWFDKLNNPHNKLLMAETSNITAGAISTDVENCSVTKDECWNWWVFGNNKNSTWMLFHLDLILYFLSFFILNKTALFWTKMLL